MSQDRHAEHRRTDPQRYGPGPLARPPLSAAGRRLLLVAVGAVVVMAVAVLVLAATR